MSAIYPYLLILACPIAMIFMMRGMHGHGAQKAGTHRETGQQSMLEAPNDVDVAALSEQRDRLEARVAELEAQMSRLEWSPEAEPRVQTPV
jgi:hypothetical protein